MATLQQIKDAADAQLATLWGSVQTKEAAYLAAHGQYWQGLRTHGDLSIPADGAAVVPTIGTAVPSYEDPADSWPTGIRTASLKFALAIHQYVTPNGTPGYVGIVYAVVLGHLYMRAQDSGGEPWRTFNWQDMGVFP